MRVSDDSNLCGRAEDMVTYMYAEASLAEATDFEQHLQLCASCRREMVSFGDVRQAIGEWRQQALGTVVSPAFEADETRAFAPAVIPVGRRSALAAFRQFFTLSPAWMRAATAAVAIVFCALAAFTVAYFVRQPQTVIVEKQVMSGYSQQEVETQIAAAIKKHDESKLKDEAVSSPEQVTVAGNDERQAQPSIERNASGPVQKVNHKTRQLTARRTRVGPSIELVSTDYLPFTASTADDELPALTDLVNDVN